MSVKDVLGDQVYNWVLKQADDGVFPSSEAQLEDFCREVGLLSFYTNSKARWYIERTSWRQKLVEIFGKSRV